jgi:hypothetical protein
MGEHRDYGMGCAYLKSPGKGGAAEAAARAENHTAAAAATPSGNRPAAAVASGRETGTAAARAAIQAQRVVA